MSAHFARTVIEKLSFPLRFGEVWWVVTPAYLRMENGPLLPKKPFCQENGNYLIVPDEKSVEPCGQP